MPGLLDHVPSVFLRGVNAGSKIELVKILSQLEEICCTFWFCHLADRAELHEILFLEIGTYLT